MIKLKLYSDLNSSLKFLDPSLLRLESNLFNLRLGIRIRSNVNRTFNTSSLKENQDFKVDKKAESISNFEKSHVKTEKCSPSSVYYHTRLKKKLVIKSLFLGINCYFFIVIDKIMFIRNCFLTLFFVMIYIIYYSVKASRKKIAGYSYAFSNDQEF